MQPSSAAKSIFSSGTFFSKAKLSTRGLYFTFCNAAITTTNKLSFRMKVTSLNGYTKLADFLRIVKKNNRQNNICQGLHVVTTCTVKYNYAKWLLKWLLYVVCLDINFVLTSLTVWPPLCPSLGQQRKISPHHHRMLMIWNCPLYTSHRLYQI